MTRISVVLPQPEGPIKETNSPRWICRSTLSSATTGVSAVWNVSERPLISTTLGRLPPSPSDRLSAVATPSSTLKTS